MSPQSANLRTATRKTKKRTLTTQAAHDAVDVEIIRSRAAHNLVEKAYRGRLNCHFQKLLAILPAGADDNPKNHRSSKAEVLDLAIQRIEQLENENEALTLKRAELIASIGR